WRVLEVRAPAADAQVFGRSDAAGDSRRQIWRFVDGSDTLDYVLLEGAGRVLQAEWRQAGKMLARSTMQFDGRGLPAGARLDFPEGPARFELSVVAVDTAAVIDPALWPRRRERERTGPRRPPLRLCPRRLAQHQDSRHP